MPFVDVKLVVSSFSPNFSYGVDADGTKGGLAVFSWYQGVVTCVLATPNYILCNLDDGNGSNRNVMFVYGEPKVEDRTRVWDELTTLLLITPNCLLIGDFNQVECLQDKLGGSLVIKGLDAFIDWRLDNGVLEVPFSGPRFTWTNKRLDNGLILERLDKAFCTDQWFADFPEGRIFHEPIVVSDHAVIIYDSNPSMPRSNRPYQIERWCLRYNSIEGMTNDIWDITMNGFSMFVLAKHLNLFRNRAQKWCLDNRTFWGVNWRSITNDLSNQGNAIVTIKEGEEYVKGVNDIIPKCRLDFHHWQQRLKDKWVREGDFSSTTLFNRVKQRQKRKEILSLKNDDGEWVSGHDDIADLIQGSLKKVFIPSLWTGNQLEDDIDLLFHEMAFPQLDESEALALVRPFSG
ncbi:uncharacterized protein LOC110713414 [Chenopodium quinoa]|uniref:uncharacterized protein LOC110713414 n=1 Tax=Chenopodium quinoa TaxID=63459 RepID=UPI000B76F8AE|nr:uncharacterized protein LOC110713414 [Chenopodium quinoa]